MAKHISAGLADRLRATIQASGQTLSELGRAAGLDHGRLSRFVRGERDLTLQAADQLCAVLGLSLHQAEPAAGARATKGAPEPPSARSKGKAAAGQGSKEKPASKGRGKKGAGD